MKLPVMRTELEDGFRLSVSKNCDFSEVQEVELKGLLPIDGEDPGYFVIPRGIGSEDYSLFYFARHPEDFSTDVKECNMSVFGAKTSEGTYLAVISGMRYDYRLHIERKDGRYFCYPIFELFGRKPYEDLAVDYYLLQGEDADYSGMARRYRRYQIEHNGLKPIIEREKLYPELGYARDSVLVRIRLGWKMAPPEVLHQTLENEPPMHVACDFDRVSELLDEFKRQGIEKADFCLVGWNVKGHDGRWPQAFPVEEALGGEEKLKKLIKKAQNLGYTMNCHTNHTDQYEIAENFSADNIRRDRDGKPVYNGQNWSGGEMSQLCPKIGYEQAARLLPKVAALGFHGMHYVDVLSIVYPRQCFHPDHPVNAKESLQYARAIAQLSRKLFGGFSSEGGFDFLAPDLDYGLYISFGHDKGMLCDRSIPFWELVYHGYVLYNPYTDTVNSAFKGTWNMLKSLEFGGRPSYYFYSAFMSNGANWMGAQEPRCDSDEEMRASVATIRKDYELYRQLDALHTAFMEKHEQVADGIFETTYSNGTVIRVDYNQLTYEVVQ